jgi:hypothetical protein
MTSLQRIYCLRQCLLVWLNVTPDGAVALVTSALAGVSLCLSHSAGVQGCSQSVAGQPSAAAIRAYIVAPSIDSRMISA